MSVEVGITRGVNLSGLVSNSTSSRVQNVVLLCRCSTHGRDGYLVGSSNFCSQFLCFSSLLATDKSESLDWSRSLKLLTHCALAEAHRDILKCKDIPAINQCMTQKLEFATNDAFTPIRNLVPVFTYLSTYQKPLNVMY